MSSNAARPQLQISVAMCTFNAGRFLQEQLHTIASQTLAPAEMVVCDDGSSDVTLKVLHAFQKDAAFPVTIVQNRHNLGYSRNFEQAIRLCSSDVVALSDQDDQWHPQKLQALQERFADDDAAGGIFSDGDLIDTESRPLPGTLWQSFDFDDRDLRRINDGDGVRVLLRRNVVTGMALAFRREWADSLCDMPDHWPHDFWLALNLAEKNALRACRERLVAYRVHSQQQIGVPITRPEKWRYLRAHGLDAYLQLSRERNEREYLKDAVQFESLLAAAQAFASMRSTHSDCGPGQLEPLATRWWLPLAARKAQHVRRGAQLLRQGRVRRSMSALYHWRSYRDFAPTGLSALLRDLLL